MVQADFSCLPKTVIHPSEFWTLNVNIQAHINDRRVDSHVRNTNPFLVAISHYLQPPQQAEVMMFGDPLGELKCHSRRDLN